MQFYSTYNIGDHIRFILRSATFGVGGPTFDVVMREREPSIYHIKSPVIAPMWHLLGSVNLVRERTFCIPFEKEK